MPHVSRFGPSQAWGGEVKVLSALWALSFFTSLLLTTSPTLSSVIHLEGNKQSGHQHR